MLPGKSRPPERDYTADARALLAGQLAQQLGFTSSLAELLAKFTDSVEQFKRASDSLPPDGGGDPALAKLLAELVSTNNSILKRADGTNAVLETVADLKGFLKGGGQLPAGFTAPPDRDAQRAAAAALAAKRAREEAAGLPEMLAGLFGAVKRAALAGLTGNAATGSPSVPKPPSRLRRAYDAARSAAGRAAGKVRTAARGRMSRAKQAIADYTPAGIGRRLSALRASLPAVGKQVGRLGRRAGRGLAAAGRTAGRIGGGIRAGVGAGRAAGGALSGAMMGGRLGAAGGPLGAVAGMVAGTVVGGAKAVFDAGVGVFTTLTASLTRYLSPVAVLSAAISSQTSGYTGVGKAFQVLGATLGLLLLPVFTLFGGLILAVAGEIGETLLPVLKEWSKTVLEFSIDAVTSLQAAFIYCREKVIEFGEWLTKTRGGKVVQGVVAGMIPGGPLAGMAADYAGRAMKGEAGPDRYREIYDALKNGRSPNATGGAGGFDGGREPMTFLDRFRKGIGDLIEENKRAVGGQAQSTTAADAARAAQMAALNGSPIDAQMNEKLAQLVDICEYLRGQVGKPPRPKGGQQ